MAYQKLQVSQALAVIASDTVHIPDPSTEVLTGTADFRLGERVGMSAKEVAKSKNERFRLGHPYANAVTKGRFLTELLPLQAIERILLDFIKISSNSDLLSDDLTSTAATTLSIIATRVLSVVYILGHEMWLMKAPSNDADWLSATSTITGFISTEILDGSKIESISRI